MKPVKAIFFDLGGTLLYPDFEFLQKRFLSLGINLEENRFLYAISRAGQIIDDYIVKYPESSDEQRVPTYLKALLSELGMTGVIDGFITHIILPRHREINFWNYCRPGTHKFLESLKGKYPLGIISNSDGRVEKKLEEFDLKQYFKTIIDSEIVKIEKPDPKIFELACERIGVSTSDCLYIGDIYSIDVVGAKNSGLQAVLIDATGKKRDDCEVIESVFDLDSVLN